MTEPEPAPDGAAPAPAGREIVAVKPARFAKATAGGSHALAWIERHLGLTTWGVIVVLFAAFGLVLGRIVRTPAVLLLSYGIVIVVVSCYVLGRRRPAVTATRGALRTRVRAGRTVSSSVELTATRRVSTVLLEERLHPMLGRDVLVPVSVLLGGQSMEHAYTFTPRLRGVYDVGPLSVTWTDPVGLTRHRMVLAEPTKVIVHPVTDPVLDSVLTREWEDPPVRPPKSRPWPSGFEFYGMRDYVNGDDPRRIVWRKTAQTLDLVTGLGRYLVRESEQGITDRVVVILDTGTDEHSPGEPSETFELAVRAAASLGVKHLDSSFTVTMEANGETLAGSLRGRRATIPLLDSLAGATRGRATLADALDRVLTSGALNAHFAIITPHVDAAVATRLRILLERGVSVVLVLVLWEDTDLASIHRAGSLGCRVVEISATSTLTAAFRRGAAMAVRT